MADALLPSLQEKEALSMLAHGERSHREVRLDKTVGPGVFILKSTSD